MLNDLVYAARTLRRSPLLALVAIATIALGIGASTAIFTVAEAVLLRPLPYRAADRLVVATAEMRQRNAVDLPFSGPDFFDLHRGANFLTLVGGAVVIGRTFTEADGQPLTGKDAGPPEQPYLRRATTVAVLSYDYWQRRY